jgi:hypothetical protein
MNKRKVAPTNPLLRAWNEFLFTRSFEFESPLTPDELADELMTLREKGSQNIFAFLPLSRTVDVKYEGQGAYTFDMRHKRRNRGVNYTMSKAVGEITEENGRTVIRGDVKFGAFYHTLMLILAIVGVILLSFVGSFVSAVGAYPAWAIPLQVLITVSFLFFGWWRMYQDREALMALLSETLTTEKRKRAEARLSDDESLHHSDAAESDAESTTTRKRF